MNRRGLSLVEVLVAVLILAVGVLGAAALQASGLRATRTSQVMQDLDAEARSAINALRVRYAAETVTVPGIHDCGPGFLNDCSYEIRPCVLSGGQLDCTVSSAAEPDAQAIIVTVSQLEHEVSLSTIVGRGSP